MLALTSYTLSVSLVNSKEGGQISLLGRGLEIGHHWPASQLTAELSLGEMCCLDGVRRDFREREQCRCMSSVFGFLAGLGNGWSFDMAAKVLRK